ncbi:MAG: hypothetical protein QW356_07890, partial [Candidatus Hadarchaeales archaeon]
MSGLDLSNLVKSYKLEERNGKLCITVDLNNLSTSLYGLNASLAGLHVELAIGESDIQISDSISVYGSADFAVSGSGSLSGTANLSDVVSGMRGKLEVNCSASFSASGGASISGSFPLSKFGNTPLVFEIMRGVAGETSVENGRLTISVSLSQVAKDGLRIPSALIKVRLDRVHLHLQGRKLDLDLEIDVTAAGSGSLSIQSDLQSAVGNILSLIKLPEGVRVEVKNGKIVLTASVPSGSLNIFGLGINTQNFDAKLVLDSFSLGIHDVGDLPFSLQGLSADIGGMEVSIESLSGSFAPAGSLAVSPAGVSLSAEGTLSISGRGGARGSVDLVQLLNKKLDWKELLANLLTNKQLGTVMKNKVLGSTAFPLDLKKITDNLSFDNATSYQVSEEGGKLKFRLMGNAGVSFDSLNFNFDDIDVSLLMSSGSFDLSDTISFNFNIDNLAIAGSASGGGTVNLSEYISGVAPAARLDLQASLQFSVSSKAASCSGTFTLDQIESVSCLDELAGKAVSWLIAPVTGSAPTSDSSSGSGVPLSWIRKGLKMYIQLAKIYENLSGGDKGPLLTGKFLLASTYLAQLLPYIQKYGPMIIELINSLRSGGEGGGSGLSITWNGWEPTFSGSYNGQTSFQAFGLDLILTNPQGYATIKSASATLSGRDSTFSASANILAGFGAGIGISGSKTYSELLGGPSGSSGGPGPTVLATLTVERGRPVLYLNISSLTLNLSGLTVDLSLPSVKFSFNRVSVNLGNGRASFNADLGIDVSGVSASIKYTGSWGILPSLHTFDYMIPVIPLEVAGIPLEIDFVLSAQLKGPVIDIQAPDLAKQQISASIGFEYVGGTVGVGVSIVGCHVASITAPGGIKFNDPAIIVGHTSTEGWTLTLKTGPVTFGSMDIPIKLLGQQLYVIHVPQWDCQLWSGGSVTFNLSEFAGTVSDFGSLFLKLGEAGIEFGKKWVTDWLGKVGEWIDGLKVTIHEMVVKGVQQIVDAVRNGLVNAEKLIRDGWVTAVESVKAGLMKAWEAIDKGLATVWEFLQNNLLSTKQTRIVEFSGSTGEALKGTQVIFTGRLEIKVKDNEGTERWVPLPQATVELKEDDELTDEYITSVTTNSGGEFMIYWTAETKDWTGWPCYDFTNEMYAWHAETYLFGFIPLDPCESDRWSILIIQPTGETRISNFSCSNTTPIKGNSVTFSGYLEARYSNDTWVRISGATVELREDDWPLSDYCASGTTSSTGYFSISWVAEPKDYTGWPWYDWTNEMFASFSGGSLEGVNLNGCSSDKINVDIIHPTGETRITYFSGPSSVRKGNSATFTGYLEAKYSNETWQRVSGARIQLWEKDDLWLLDPDDDTGASAFTDSGGYFSISWTASALDSDLRNEMFAKYGGGDSLRGVTLNGCESGTIEVLIIQPTGETRISNFSCSNTTPIKGNSVTFSGYLE